MNITVGKHTFEIPRWNNLTWAQFYAFTKNISNEKNPALIKVRLLNLFGHFKVITRKRLAHNGITYTWFTRGNDKVLISDTAVNALTEAILGEFFTITPEGNYQLNCTLYKSIIPPFKVGLSRWYGPSDALANITFKEFIHTETNYFKYCETNNLQYLDKLIATLYRPKKHFNFLARYFNTYNADPRARFNDNLLTSRAKKIDTLDNNIKLAILYFYQGCRKFIINYFPEIFSGGGTVSTEAPDTFRMYLQLTDELAKNNPAEKEKIRNELLYDVLDSLNNILINAKKSHVRL
jgi:hypothetical protein